MIDEKLFNKWVEKEKRIVLAKKRKYPHFDLRINFNKNISFFKSYFFDSKAVKKHAFYPFIRMIIDTPRYKKTGEIINGKYVREVISKSRPIAYASHFDAFIYSWYSTLLTEKYETKIKELDIYDCVLAYIEKGKSNIEFAHSTFNYIKTKGQCVALAFDISSFFDGLDHEHLKKMWSYVIDNVSLPDDHFNVFKSLTDYTYVDKTDLEVEFPFIVKSREDKVSILRICSPKEFRDRIRRKKYIKSNGFSNKLEESARLGKKWGIPQGSPISACLSNIYMIEFDKSVNDYIKCLGGLYYRYCDDIIAVVDNGNYEKVRKFILDTILDYELEINDTKTDVVIFKQDALGKLRGFDGNDNFKNTYIRSASMSRYYKRLTARIRENLKAAYGKRSIGNKIFKKKIYNRYTNKGQRNFITYARRAKEHMDSLTIHRQYKNSMKKVKAVLSNKKILFEEKRKPRNLME
jgi:RNA-directed DNA polymerase